MSRLLWVCLGSAVGGGARYLVSLAALQWLGAGFPYGTLAVNLIGSFGIGIVMHAWDVYMTRPPTDVEVSREMDRLRDRR